MMMRMVGGWVFLLVPAHPGSPGQRAVKMVVVLLLLLLYHSQSSIFHHQLGSSWLTRLHLHSSRASKGVHFLGVVDCYWRRSIQPRKIHPLIANAAELGEPSKLWLTMKMEFIWLAGGISPRRPVACRKDDIYKNQAVRRDFFCFDALCLSQLR